MNRSVSGGFRKRGFVPACRRIAVGGGLHPRMPEKPVDNSHNDLLLGLLTLCDGDEPVRGKFLHEFDHIAARDMQLFAKMFKGWPCIAFPACEIGQVGVKLLRLLGNFWALLKPLRVTKRRGTSDGD